MKNQWYVGLLLFFFKLKLKLLKIDKFIKISKTNHKSHKILQNKFTEIFKLFYYKINIDQKILN